ncbi:hypothetical protein RB595_004351 [Gaeumannomyces hyphopodioides]
MSSTSSPDHYDFISLGSGEGGKFTAWTLARDQGKRCAVIERQWVGGSCPNVACLPSKNYVQSGKVAHELSLGGSYGLGAYTATASGQVRASMAEVKARKMAMVQGLVDLHIKMFRDTGVELIRGTGRFVGPKKIQIDGGRVITADSVVICTGSTAKIDGAIPGLVEAQPLTHVGILDLDDLPRHLLVLGGGYVGLEFAQTFQRLGSEVTLVEHNAQILKREDPDVAEALAGVLAAEGVKILTSASVARVTGRSGDSVTATVEQQGKQHVITASHILIATGRTPNTTDIGLETAGVELAGGGGGAGHVKVDARLRTTADGVFAVGDCAGSPHFTHVGFDDFRVVHDQLAGVEARRRPGGVAGRQVPSTLFTSPELAQVGLREREAREKGVAVRVARLPMAAFLRTRTLGGGAAAVGFAKVLVEADGDGILGFAALGPSAGEMLPVVQLAMRLGAPYTEIANLIVVHPTMCEGLVQLFASVPARK